jgi:serine/threonine protein kinase/Tfp pilus assembly protein PilF
VQIGPYTVESELARGGMGVVYRARSPQGQAVAVKLLLQLGGDRDLERRERFRREVEALARLRHPGVVPVLDAGEERGCPYLVLELVQGESLDAVLARAGRLPVERAAELIHEVALALHYAHACGLLHRDLKPANLLLEHDSGRVRLTDFGLVKDLDQASLASLSKSGQMLGTPGYWSPEQAGGKRALIDARSDVYGLGATLYALLTGTPPFHGESLIEVVSAMQEPAQPPSSRRAEIDAELDAIVLRCLAQEPADRYASADALARALGAWLRPPPPTPPTSKAPILLAIALSLTGLGAAGVLVATAGPDRPSGVASSPSRARASSPVPLRSPEADPPATDPREHPDALLALDQADSLIAEHDLEEARAVVDGALALTRTDRVRARLHVQRGWTLYEADPRGAQAELDTARALVPDLAAAYLLAARLRFVASDVAGAEAELSRLLSANPAPEYALPAYLGRASVFLMQRRFAAAEADFGAALALDPSSTVAWSQRANVRASRGDDAGALADFEEAIRRGDESVVTLTNQAHILRRLGRGVEALAAVTHARQVHPERAEPVSLHAQLLMELGRYREARSSALRVIESLPDERTARGVLAVLTARYGEPDLAREHLATIAGEATSSGLLAGALLAERDGNPADCDAFIAQALQLEPLIVYPRAIRGYVLQQRGDPAALAEFNAVLEQYPDHLAVLLDRGFHHYSHGNLTLAAVDADRAVELAPEFPFARLTRARVRRQQGDYTGAMNDLQRATELDPTLEEGYELTLEVTWLRGAHDEAIQGCRELIRRSRPGTYFLQEVQLRLAAFLRALQRRDEADVALREALPAETTSWGSALYQRGVVLYEVDEFAAAREDLVEALGHLPDGAAAGNARALITGIDSR